MRNPFSPAPSRQHLVLPSSLSELDRVVQEVQAFAERHSADEDFIYRVVLLTTEAVTNAIEHGNGDDPSKFVRLDLEAAPGYIEVCVEDEGTGFDPANIANPLLDENLLREGGRGLFLIQSMADEYRFEREGRRLRMIFRHSS